MKKFLLLITFTVYGLQFAVGQTSVYHPFPDSDAVWNIGRDSSVDISGDFDAHYYSYSIIGDTTIGSNSYHKIYVPYARIYSPYNNVWSYQSGYRAGFLRQDTALKKVYFYIPYYPYYDTAEWLLYDFNLQVGDTLPQNLLTGICFSQPPITYPIVVSIDSILISGTYRKRWNINAVGTLSIIEGIGSTSGLIEGICPAEDPPQFSNLFCFSQNGITLYPDSTSSCNAITSIENMSTDRCSIVIYPNPTHDNFTINLIGELKIYDAMGRVVHEQLLNRKQETVHCKLNAGIYFVRVRDAEKTYTQKLVIE